MKKFSKITNQKVNEEPKSDNKIDEASFLKVSIIGLMDRLLKIQSYGAVDNRFLTGSVKIQGKEMLAEALIELLNDKNIKEQTKILEGLKNKIGDWETIDKEIESLSRNKVSLNNKAKFSKMLERYADEDSLYLYLESNIDKLNSETLSDYQQLTLESNLKNKDKISNLLNNK